MKMHALSGVHLGPAFHAVVDEIAAVVPAPRYPNLPVFLDDLPDSSARVDLMRLAVLVALERSGDNVHTISVTGHSGYLPDHGWLISREDPSPGLTFLKGARQPEDRIATVVEGADGVHVTVGAARFVFQPPPEEECRQLLKAGVRGTPIRFPVFPSPSPFLLARGDGPDEVLLWRLGLPTARFRLPGPVLAATHVGDHHQNTLVTLIEFGGELLVHVTGEADTDLAKLHVPIDFSVADEAAHDLSPLYFDMDEAWDFGVYFRRGGEWWTLRWWPSRALLRPSTSKVHEPDSFPFHTRLDGAGKVLFGPNWTAGRRDAGWTAWRHERDDVVIPVTRDEEVMGLTELGDLPALLTREGDVVRVRTANGVRTVAESAGTVNRHHQLPWVAVQRSPHLVEIIDIATGVVLHTLDTA
ncbi:hypothetical protein [Lentzea cavernae]|uniref:Uncharacterized protein n=1 Tax=Lentzea cavernae TaxID=2020703 RepID=A0ABQ3MRH9_9PSEU|nr:hypothetical protein [Lentzea cavernae]GHH53746.1 hypothetical protein GCM10017774_67560 [Lentzea cavernae]